MRTAIATVALCLMLAACEGPQPPYESTNDLVIVDEDPVPCRPTAGTPCPPRP